MKSFIVFAVSFALILGCSVTRAGATDKADGEVTIMADVMLGSPEAAVPIAKVGDAEIAIRPVPKKKEKDAPSMALFVGDAIKSKTVFYPGKSYHVAVTKIGSDRLRLFVNGYPDDQPVAGTLSGAITPIAPHVAADARALSADQILSKFREALQLKKPILTVAHRGIHKHAPENTRVSYVQAIEAGSPILEFDTALTADGHIVGMHDKTVDRTTNGKGKIAEMTLEQVRKLDAGSWKDPKYKGEPVPTIDEIASVAKDGNAILMLDLKAEGQGSAIANWLETSKYPHEKLIVAPWTDEEAIALRKHVPADVPMIRLTSKVPTETVNDAYFAKMKELGISGFSVNWQYLTAEFAKAAKKNGMKIYVWTLNDPPDLAGAALLNPDGIVTDDTANTKELLAELVSSK